MNLHSLHVELGSIIVSSCVRKTIPAMEYSDELGTELENHRDRDDQSIAELHPISELTLTRFA